MQVVDHVHEVLRRAIPAGRGEVTLHLVTPRTIKRVLHHWHQLDVREAKAGDVIAQLVRHLAIREVSIVFLWDAHPRAEVHLVNGPRRGASVGPRPLAHPGPVAPVVGQIPYDGRLSGRRLSEGRERVGLVHAGAGHTRMDVVLVQRAVADTRHEALPDPRLLTRVERVGVLVPVIEVTDDANRVGVRRPHRKRSSLRVFRQVRAQLLVEMAVRPLVEEVKVEWSQQGGGDQAGAIRSRMPRSGIRTQSGRKLSS